MAVAFSDLDFALFAFRGWPAWFFFGSGRIFRSGPRAHRALGPLIRGTLGGFFIIRGDFLLLGGIIIGMGDYYWFGGLGLKFWGLGLGFGGLNWLRVA